jgi:hypothetical protein
MSKRAYVCVRVCYWKWPTWGHLSENSITPPKTFEKLQLLCQPRQLAITIGQTLEVYFHSCLCHNLSLHYVSLISEMKMKSAQSFIARTRKSM